MFFMEPEFWVAVGFFIFVGILVYVGVPNRCSMRQLARFAAVCGVESAVKGALSNPVNLARFVLGFDPRYIVDAIQGHPRLAKVHVYASGNFAAL